jgi:hypothetical protein
MGEHAQFASDLLELEKLHLLKLALWGAISVILGSLLIAVLRVRRTTSPLLLHFGIQSAAWGGIDLLIVWWASRGLALRDYAGAVALDRFLWFNVGLDAGYVLVGLTLAICGWKLGRKLGLVGAGLGIIVQGLALLVLDLQLTAGLVR